MSTQDSNGAEDACARSGASKVSLTVLSAQVDPYRLDTPAGHRDGAWLAEQLDRFYGATKSTHWRALHYAIVQHGGSRKPDGSVYTNTDDDWRWLIEGPGKSARWLGYIPFNRITDHRNAAPIIHRRQRVQPRSWLSIGLDVDVPDAGDIEPLPIAQGFVARQSLPVRHLRGEIVAR
jgi:hypothetical protein